MKQKQPITIDDLEESARQEADGSKSYRINSVWLEVIVYRSNGIGDERIAYIWGKKQVDRKDAIEVLKMQK